MTIVENIKRLCKENGITINKLEQNLEIGRGNIARWDTNMPSIDKVLRVAEYFGVTVSDLVQIDHPVQMGGVDSDLAEYLTDLRDRPETRALLEASRCMTKEQVEAMAAFAKQLRGDPFAD